MAEAAIVDGTRQYGIRPGLMAAALLALAACAEREAILPGEREAIRPAAAQGLPEGVPVPALTLPPSQANADWTHLNGGPTHLAPAAALAPAPSLRWSVNIGEGNARRQRMTSAPVVANGVVYTLDAGAMVTAVSTAGRVLWRTNLTPGREQPTEGFGGGLAVEGDALVAATGFGETVRLDPRSGEVIWRTQLEGPVRSAPTIGEGKAVVVARGDIAYGINLNSGQADWRLQGVGQGAGIVGGASPAVRGPVAVLPFLAGEMRAVLVRNGLTVWSAGVTGGHRDAVRARISDLSGDPVIDFDVVYAANQSGAMSALDRRSGRVIWTQADGSNGPALPVGGSVFVVTDAADLLRLDARDGQVIWRQPLPEWVRPDRRRQAVPHYGPLLAGGRLIVASGDGVLRSFDPASGGLVGEVSLPAGAAAQPAIAAGVLYVVTEDGRLNAFQ